MPFKRRGLDIRQINLPKKEAMVSEFTYDPEAELTEEQWDNIMNCLRTVERPDNASKAEFFIKNCCMIYFIYPKHFPRLQKEFQARMENVLQLVNRRGKHMAVTDVIHDLARKIFIPDFRKPDFTARNLTATFKEQGRFFSVLDAIALIYLYPEQLPELRDILNADQHFDYWSSLEGLEHGLGYLAIKKLLLPSDAAERELTAADVADIKERIKRYLDDEQNPKSLQKYAFKLSLYLKLLSMKKISITPHGFIDSALQVERQLSEDIYQQPEQLDI